MEAVISKPQRGKAKLSDAQLVILSAAAQRPDGSLLPLPDSLATKGAALNRVMIEILCKRKLAEERPTIKGAPEWCRDEDGQPLGLFITKAGLLALGIDDAGKEKSSRARASMPRQRKTAAAKPRGKARKASSVLWPTGFRRKPSAALTPRRCNFCAKPMARTVGDHSPREPGSARESAPS